MRNHSQEKIESFALSNKSTDLFKLRVALLRDEGGFAVLQKMVEFLEPLMKLTNKFGSDNVVSSSLVVPMLLRAKQLIDERIKIAQELHDERG